MENVVCIYHSRDLDGWMSGAIVKLWYEKEKDRRREEEAMANKGGYEEIPPIKLIGWDYGMPAPQIRGYRRVIMVDVSLPMAEMVKLSGDNNWGLTWIDHHISAIKAYREEVGCGESFCATKHDENFAACELTWQYFFPDTPMPELVRLLGRYDCFGHKGTEEELKVLEFQYGARQLISSVDEAYSTLLIAKGGGDWSFDADLCDEIHLKGRAIYAYLCSEAKQSYKKIFPIELDGWKFACINQERFNPVNFGIDYHADGYDGFACFWYDKGQFTYSLYNDNGLVDCSVIAKKRGGGGHKGASGFRSETIIIA